MWIEIKENVTVIINETHVRICSVLISSIYFSKIYLSVVPPSKVWKGIRLKKPNVKLTWAISVKIWLHPEIERSWKKAPVTILNTGADKFIIISELILFVTDNPREMLAPKRVKSTLSGATEKR